MAQPRQDELQAGDCAELDLRAHEQCPVNNTGAEKATHPARLTTL